MEEARTTLEQDRNNLADLEGNRLLKLQERQAAVEADRADLAQAKDDQADLEKEPDRFLLQSLQAAVEADQASLSQAEKDLDRLLEGPDAEDLAVLEKQVTKKQAELNDLLEVDLVKVALKEADVASAHAKVDDALEELLGAVVTAPFPGIISLVNVKLDDMVTEDSRALELIDPTEVRVDGLVDATDVAFVKEEDEAGITIDSLPGLELAGFVTFLAESPRTERGVVSYPVQIQVDLPPGTEVPVGPSSVSVVVFGGGIRG